MDSLSKRVPVAEIFGPTIQGEGAHIGRPSVFVRFGGCDFRCSWCDSMHAVDPKYSGDWHKMAADEVCADVALRTEGLPALVTFSGGNPAIHDLSEIVSCLKAHDHIISVETQGTRFCNWFAYVDEVTFSPKPPSSGMEHDLEKLIGIIDSTLMTTRASVKVVIQHDTDLDWFGCLRALLKQKKIPVPLFVQPCNLTREPDIATDDLNHIMINDLRQLAQAVLERKWFDVAVLPQLHCLIWGNAAGV